MILAGGASRRMGRDKLALTVGGVPIIQRVYDVLANRCEEILIVTSEGSPRDYGLAARFISDLRPGREGPLAAMEAGLAAARNGHVFVAAGDAPFVPEGLVGFLLNCVTEDGVRAAVPRYGGRLHPLCTAYERDVLADLSFALNAGMRAVRDFLDDLGGVRYVEAELERFGDPEVFLMNVNSPEDLERARAVLCGPPDTEL
ncbi:MAG: molybdenum cofactor guanylyltransferase [Actinomycetota bacterium]|nr:molybdenum cofactor guanylyltransferase [Actinomycetota bacterium]